MTSDLILQTMTLTKDRPVLSSERIPQRRDRDCQTDLVMSPRWGSTPRLTVGQSQCDFDFDFDFDLLSEL
jgi:hypothetical protein